MTESKNESKNREDTTESAVAPIHERWPVTPAQMSVAIERVASCRQETLHSISSIIWGGLVFLILGAFLELPVKILLELFGFPVNHTIGFWIVAIFLVVVLIAFALRIPGLIQHANRPKFDLIDIDRINDAVTQRPPCRICPVCGDDPFQVSECCKDFPAGWTEDDCQAFWFNLATRKKKGESDLCYRQERGNLGGSMARPKVRFLGRWPRSWRLALTITLVALMPLNWWFGIRLYGGSVVWYPLCGFWLFALVPSWLFHQLIPDIGSTGTDAARSETLRPTCEKCRYKPDAYRDGRCPECGVDFTEAPPSFRYEWSAGRTRHHLILLALVLLGILPHLLLFGGVISEQLTGMKNRWSSVLPDDYAMASNDRLIEMLGRPITHTNFSQMNRALRDRSEDLTTDQWDRLARNVTGPGLWTLPNGRLNTWARAILCGSYPQPVPVDALTALDRGLWEPSFQIDVVEKDRSSLSWINEKHDWNHLLVVTALRVDGESIPMPESRSWMNPVRDTLELPVSADRLRSAEVEIDLILFKYQDINAITSSKGYRTALAEARRNGTPPPIPPSKQPVEFDEEDAPILIPHVWKRSLTRTVNPGAESG